ncbi:MAG: lysophospholipid acyltransferase family protein [Rugosibacter sp.]|nr:lysophospholipid acyltransferase family protein [Rugosibacter sp.]MDO9273781.1 lysophospholipid acyltransferase family protein [Rugosibacter sp.]
MATPQAQSAGNLRAIFRLSRTALHLTSGILTVALIYPFIKQDTRLALKQRWSRQLLTVLGIRLKVGAGDTPRSKYPWGAANNAMAAHPVGLLVANHISFLDIFVINAWAPAAFVSKDDVRGWPLIGWLSQHTDTIFMQRGSRRAAQATRDQLVSQLRAGQLIAVFPEGTTSDGHTVQPFHSALFQSAIDATAPVMPLALSYFDAHSHQPSHAADYVGDMTLVSCLWSIAASAGLIAQLEPLPALTPDGLDRRHLAAHAHHAVAHRLMHMKSLRNQ